jgi:hypothetical protein
LLFRLPFVFATDIVIKKDGGIFKTIRANARQELSIPISRAGVYRAEIFLAAGRFNKLPWIVTNPIFIARPAVEKDPPAKITAVIPTEGENYFRIEKNGRSNAAIHWDAQGKEPPVTRFAFTLQSEAPGQADFWAALAHRQNIAGAGRHGFVFETRGSVPLRFWLQLRTGSRLKETAYQHSFPVSQQWQQVVIPFSSFHRLYGPAAVFDPAELDSFFFLIDNGNAFAGARGEVFFRRIGLY